MELNYKDPFIYGSHHSFLLKSISSRVLQMIKIPSSNFKTLASHDISSTEFSGFSTTTFTSLFLSGIIDNLHVPFFLLVFFFFPSQSKMLPYFLSRFLLSSPFLLNRLCHWLLNRHGCGILLHFLWNQLCHWFLYRHRCGILHHQSGGDN